MQRLLFVLLQFCLLAWCTGNADAYRLPDTGPAKCYQSVSPYTEISCDGTGQDGAYNINPMSYTDFGNGTVTDNNTGLMWQSCSVGQNNDSTCTGTAVTYNWFQASGTYNPSYNPFSLDTCGALTLGGWSDWRLPSRKELTTIADYSIPYPGPPINTTYFPNTLASRYWSSTASEKLPDRPGGAWYVVFTDGDVSFYPKGGYMYVRCVRGGQPAQNFADNGNGTVTDNKTGLVWQQGEPGAMTWGSALSYCKELSLGGNADWRLPNSKELESLTGDRTDYPPIDFTFFPNVVLSSYYSSTTEAGNPYLAWVVDFTDWGSNVFVYGNDKSSGMNVRCVRGGVSICAEHAVIREGKLPYYTTIQDTYDAAETEHANDSILIQAMVFKEDLNFDGDINVTLSGGYDCDFSTHPGQSTIQGSLTIGNGSATIENIVIQ